MSVVFSSSQSFELRPESWLLTYRSSPRQSDLSDPSEAVYSEAPLLPSLFVAASSLTSSRDVTFARAVAAVGVVDHSSWTFGRRGGTNAHCTLSHRVTLSICMLRNDKSTATTAVHGTRYQQPGTRARVVGRFTCTQWAFSFHPGLGFGRGKTVAGCLMFQSILSGFRLETWELGGKQQTKSHEQLPSIEQEWVFAWDFALCRAACVLVQLAAHPLARSVPRTWFVEIGPLGLLHCAREELECLLPIQQ